MKLHPLETTDLMLMPADVSFGQSLAEFYVRNRFYLQPFEGERAPLFFRNTYQKDILLDEVERGKNDEDYRFYLFQKDNLERVIGVVGLNNVLWGSFRSSFIGYKLDELLQGRGYMTQAITAVVDFAFDTVHLHRIEGNVMPHNARSLRVLEKCGFYEEGLAIKYLYINGRWEDHIHMVRHNDDDCGEKQGRLGWN